MTKLGNIRYQVRKQLRQEGKTEAEIKLALESNPLTNPNLSTENTDSNSNENLPSNNEEVQVDNHTETESGFGSLIGRARESLLNNLDAPEKPRRGRKPGSTALAGKDDFLALVVSLITLAVTFIRVDDRLKPNKDEITSFSDHLAGIILRHSSISGKLSADAMAVIGMVMVGAAYYQRVSPVLAELKSGQTSQPQTRYVDRGNGFTEVQQTESIALSKITQASADFLDNAVESHREDY